MKTAEAMARVMRDMHADLGDYDALREALQRQFAAALKHDSERLAELAGQVTDMVARLEERRRVRARVVDVLCGPHGRMNELFARMPAPMADRCRAMWRELERKVGECKQLNVRNCLLITSQFEIMHRVMHGEEDTYAPA
ncbi:flagellar export chaperone FlgN [Methyloversatilis thermotolerans]|uniref:flagellar export chaperone FlgN n=1 Tax=Methyloversatilis thermotolerans TaxID=1346290 RepID=UPI00035C1B22|nr:flagellar export chaperone FlgN [Methyloversatilis thermotolerans]